MDAISKAAVRDRAKAWAKDLMGKIKEYYVYSFALPQGFSLVMSRPESGLITIGLEQDNHFYDCLDVSLADYEEIVDELIDIFWRIKGD